MFLELRPAVTEQHPHFHLDDLSTFQHDRKNGPTPDAKTLADLLNWDAMKNGEPLYGYRIYEVPI